MEFVCQLWELAKQRYIAATAKHRGEGTPGMRTESGGIELNCDRVCSGVKAPGAPTASPRYGPFVSRPLVIVVAQTRSYVSGEIEAAAAKLDVELRWVTDRCHVLANEWPEGAIPIELSPIETAVEVVLASIAGDKPVAVLGTDEPTAVIAELLARELGVSASVNAASRARDKLAFRSALQEAGIHAPRFTLLGPGVDIAPASIASVGFPAVLKPRCLSASRGVVRVNSEAELVLARRQIVEVVNDAEVRGVHRELAEGLLLEEYVEGPEVAYEGFLRGGELRTITIFDKPSDLSGPTFPESIYVTPSSLASETQQRIKAAVRRAAEAIELRDGPIHAELRLGGVEPIVIDLAARSIGGLCGRTLESVSGHTVAEVVLAGLCQIPLSDSAPPSEPRPSGVLMIGVDRAGIFLGVDGVDEGMALAGVTAIEITMPSGQTVGPLPSRSDYLGFAFASGETTLEVAETLGRLGEILVPQVRPQIDTVD